MLACQSEVSIQEIPFTCENMSYVLGEIQAGYSEYIFKATNCSRFPFSMVSDVMTIREFTDQCFAR